MAEEMKPCEASPDCLHVPCEHCGAGIRTGSDRAIHHPGTRSGALKYRQCTQCRKRGGPPVPTVPDRCVDCYMPFRPRSATLADHPGTVRHEGHGQCVSCYNLERREEAAAYHREVHRLKMAKKRAEQPDDPFKYEGDIRMPDRDMERIRREYPAQYEWHMLRRRRIDDPEFRQRVYKLSRHDGHPEELMAYDQH